jgi:hypothetical protein
VSVAALLASSGVINVVSRNQVSQETINSQTVNGYRFEPSSAAGGTWVSAWATYPVSNPSAVTSYVGAWNGSSWQQPSVPLTPPNSAQTWDVNLSWDSTRSRFVFALLDSLGNIWYGYSTGVSATCTPALSSQTGSFLAPNPIFVGLAPCQVGLYQVNFTVPPPNGAISGCDHAGDANLRIVLSSDQSPSFDTARICIATSN